MLKINEIYNLAYITEEEDKTPENFVMGFSARHGGMSGGHLESLNMSFNRGDEFMNVVENYRRFSSALELQSNLIYVNHQVHGDKIRIITEETLNEFPPKTGYHEEIQYDASITNCKGVTLTVTHADCIPVIFFDEENHCIGAAHSGWKSTALDIAGKTALAMKDNFKTDLKKLKVWIGPGICKECFQVREDVYKHFSKYTEMTEKISEEHYIVDMKNIIKVSLCEIGVSEENIKDFELCTCCNSGLFFSHRRDKGATGAMSAFVAMRKDKDNEYEEK